MSRKKNAPLIGLVVFLVLGGCVSQPPRRVSINTELPTDLPKKLKDKFEIKEISQLGTFPSPTPSPELWVKGKKGKAKKNKSRDLAMSSSVPSPAPSPVVYAPRRIPGDPIWIGEKLTYSISYFGISAGDVSMEILPFKVMDNRKVYHVRVTATSSAVFSVFYRLNDVVETFMDYESLFSHRFHVVLDETKQTRDSLELHDYEKNQTFFWNRWNRKNAGYVETKEYAPILPYSQDSLSALYYTRLVPLTVGAVFSAPIISEAKYFEAVCTVLRKERMSTPMGPMDTFVIKPEMKYQGILKKSGDSFLWLTDDDRRMPVRLEAKVKIGTVVASLKAVTPGEPPEVAATVPALPKPSPIPSP